MSGNDFSCVTSDISVCVLHPRLPKTWLFTGNFSFLLAIILLNGKGIVISNQDVFYFNKPGMNISKCIRVESSFSLLISLICKMIMISDDHDGDNELVYSRGF